LRTGHPISASRYTYRAGGAGKIRQTPHTAHYLTLMRDKVIDALSISFDPMRWTMEERGPDLPPLRKIQEVRLWEILLVTFGADPLARVSDVHGPTSPAACLQRLEEAERIAATWARQPAVTMSSAQAAERLLNAQLTYNRVFVPRDTQPSWSEEYDHLRRSTT
jgi:hypothetical protein